MTGEVPLPRYEFRRDQASLREMLFDSPGDVASVIPAAILDEPAVKLPLAGSPLIVAAPGLARDVLNDRSDHFVRDRFIRRVFRRSWGQGIAGAEGEAWQRQRRAAVPFFRPQAVNRHLAAFALASRMVAEQLESGAETELGRLAARIVARIVLSVLVDARGAEDPDTASVDLPDYVRRITGFTALDLLPLPERLIDRLQGIDSDPAVQRLRMMGTRLARARDGGAQTHDLIALLDGVGPLEDNIRGLFPAAMDTTVAGLGWALYTLARHPEWQERVAAEGRAMGDAVQLDRLEVTRRVVSEVLRLYPPAPLLARAAGRDMEIAGHRVRKGQTVIVAIYALHRHRSQWDDPDTFDPDRFLPGRGPYDAYMPFGTGPRMCIAAHFAQAEIAVVLASVLARLRLEPTGPEPQVSLGVATRSLNGLHVRVQPCPA
jgi:cytochrome P450